jgi:hypothetical protein
LAPDIGIPRSDYMARNNFFGGGIGGTVTPRSRGGSIRWHGTLGSDNNATSIEGDLSSAIASLGAVIVGTWLVTRVYPKGKKAFDAQMSKKSKGIVDTAFKPVKATFDGAAEVIKDPTGVKL